MEKKSGRKSYVPSCKKPRLEFFDSGQKAVDRYNELLFDPHTHSIYLDPVRNKKGFWVVEVQEFTEEWLNFYRKKR